MNVTQRWWRPVDSNVVMLKLVLFLLLPSMSLANGCFCQQPMCCRYLMAPSTIYVQMDPSAYGIVHPASSPSTTSHPSSTTAAKHEQIFTNHLQWTIVNDKPWEHGNNVYYAVNAQATPHPGSPAIDLNQPTLYFMPNWWSKIQQAANIPSNSPFAIQLNNQPIPIPSLNPAPHPVTYHSYAPQHNEEEVAHDPQPSATITVLNEQSDLLPQSAKEAQELLLQIQKQLAKLNQQNESKKDEKHIDTPTTHSNQSSDTKRENLQVDATTTTTKVPDTTTAKLPDTTTTQPVARIVSADSESKSDERDARNVSAKSFNEKPARSFPQVISQENQEVETRRTPSSTIGRENKLVEVIGQENIKNDSSSLLLFGTQLFLLIQTLLFIYLF